MPIETQIEQKLTSYEYTNNYQVRKTRRSEVHARVQPFFQVELQDIQRLIDRYEQLINHINRSLNHPINNLHSKIQSHCECKLDLYKKMLNDFFRKSQSKHVSFDGSINFNNNNSSIFHTSSFTPQQYTSPSSDFNSNLRQKKYRRTTETCTTSNDTNRK